MPVLSLHLRYVLPLRTGTGESTLEPMDARLLVPLLADERMRFVRLARRRLPSEADAEDIVQRAMMRATERAGSLEDPARVRPWFGRILRRGIADFYRSRRPEGRPDSDEEAPTDTPDARGRVCACSLRLLDALPPSYAEVLRRVDVEGESTSAVAGALSISPANLHVRLHRARRALRDRVKKHCGVATCSPCLDCTCGADSRCGATGR
jgi:RNA polymerase sigma factor (sigma-70 family)